MPDLQTKVEIPTPDFTIGYNNAISLLGSCFSDNIGLKLKRLKFNACINPFGVLYNPASISIAIDNLLNKDTFKEKDLSYHNDLWFSYAHHSSFSNADKDTCLSNINQSFTQAKRKVEDTDVWIITLGTSWIYRLKETNQVVANCHKVTSDKFNREFIDIDEIHKYLNNALTNLLTLRPDAKVIFTVSPIRHWKDGAIENMRSKASLILAIKKIQATFSQCYYFPTYEIYMDELRDYRFYDSDMLHPSEFSINLIWLRFVETFLDKKSTDILKKVEKLVKSYEHKTFNTQTNAYQKFANKLIQSTEEFEKQHPAISFSEEKNKLLNFV